MSCCLLTINNWSIYGGLLNEPLRSNKLEMVFQLLMSDKLATKLDKESTNQYWLIHKHRYVSVQCQLTLPYLWIWSAGCCGSRASPSLTPSSSSLSPSSSSTWGTSDGGNSGNKSLRHLHLEKVLLDLHKNNIFIVYTPNYYLLNTTLILISNICKYMRLSSA